MLDMALPMLPWTREICDQVFLKKKIYQIHVDVLLLLVSLIQSSGGMFGRMWKGV